MQERGSGFNTGRTNAEGKGGTLKEELNKIQMSIQIFYSSENSQESSIILPDFDSVLKEIIKSVYITMYFQCIE